MKNKIKLLIFLNLFSFISFSQGVDCVLQKDSVKSRMLYMVSVLAHDSLGGREAGTIGEIKAARFISEQFQEIGLASIYEDGSYLQPFDFVDGIILTKGNYMRMNKKEYTLMTDFYPLNNSGNGVVEGEVIKVGYGVVAEEFQYNDYTFYLNDALEKDIKGKIFAIEMGVPKSIKDEANMERYGDLEVKVKKAIEYGASAVIFISSDKNISQPKLDKSKFVQPLSIPVVFADRQAYKTIMDSNMPSIELGVDIEKDIRVGKNVIGYIDNNAEKTIVLGAHFDHLGMGGGVSRYNGEPAVHPGADDNASGVAAITEIARYLKCSNFVKYNVLFVAFSAEEKGLLGSNYFTKSKDFAIREIAFMLNLDMVGRIDSAKNAITVIATSSSPQWPAVIDSAAIDGLKPIKSAQVSGGSDHSSFYNNSIPVLFFFSGLHDDYHKPGDVVGKLNFDGIYNVVQLVLSVIDETTEYKSIEFSKSKVENKSNRRNSSISLGLIPDHAYDGIGLRISDVTIGKPAIKAGLLKGDVITSVNDYEVRDIYSYMNALGKLKKGSKVNVIVLRDGRTMEFSVQL